MARSSKVQIARRLEEAYSFGSELGPIRKELTGSDFIDFGFGDVSLDTPVHIRDAAKKAIDEGYTRYVLPTSGMPELRNAIAAKLNTDNGLTINPETDVLVTVGASEAINLIAFGLINPGDEVIVDDPCWTVWKDVVKTAGGTPVLVGHPEERGFRIDPSEIQQKVSSQTRAIVVNSPNNPTASVLGKNDLDRIATIAKEHDLLVIADEVYEKIVFADHRHFSIAALPGMKERTIVVNAFSKTYAMTGWRIGYCVAPEHLMKYLINFHTQMVTCVSGVSQKAGLAALTGPQDFLDEARETYEKRMELLVDGLNSIDGIRCQRSAGTFYVYPSVSKLPLSAFEFARYIARKTNVLLYSATAFGEGGKGYLRLSVSKPTLQEIEKGLERIRKAVRELPK